MRRHLHVHALMACGGLDAAGQWRAPKRSPTFLFPVHALSRVFRGKFIAALQQAGVSGDFTREPATTPEQRRARLRELTRHDWVVYAKTPLSGPAVVLDYLSRHTHRAAVSNERILGVDAGGVHLRVRADDHGGKRTVVIDGVRFIARFLQHVLPAGFKRIRHYGLLSPALQGQRLAAARAALQMPQANPHTREDAAAFLERVACIDIAICPHCRRGRWLTTQILAPTRGPAASADAGAQPGAEPGAEPGTHCRASARCRAGESA